MYLGAEPNMDAGRRGEILLQISNGRTKEARVLEVLQTLPAWAEAPFKGDQVVANAAVQAYNAAQPIVRNIESRLVTTPGPIWKELTPEEQLALNNWSKAVDQLYVLVNTYFPSASQEYIGQIALLAIAVGAFLAPIFLDEPEKPLSLPFDIEPPMIPSLRPPPRAPAPTAERVMPVLTSTSFSRIPPRPTGATGVPSPLRVQAEVMRPAASVPPTPWRRPEAPAAPAAPAAAGPGYRTFARPLGPETPIASRIQTPAEAAASTFRPPPVASPFATSPHGPPTFPRFRRQ
jgi:hypothetical protein